MNPRSKKVFISYQYRIIIVITNKMSYDNLNQTQPEIFLSPISEPITGEFFFKNLKDLFLIICMEGGMGGYVHMSAVFPGGQQRASELLELELWPDMCARKQTARVIYTLNYAASP